MKELREGRRLCSLGGHGVDRKLSHMKSGPDVFWSPRGNSYVVVKLDEPRRVYGTLSDAGYLVVSINGIGEIRWANHLEDHWMDAETKSAVNYFFKDAGDETTPESL